MNSVQLYIADPQHEIRGATMAGAAFRAARIAPGLLPDPARSAPILDREFFFAAFGRYQRRVGLALVPPIRITRPLSSLLQHNPRFDPLGRRGIIRFDFEGKSFDQHGAIGGVPAT